MGNEARKNRFGNKRVIVKTEYLSHLLYKNLLTSIMLYFIGLMANPIIARYMCATCGMIMLVIKR